MMPATHAVQEMKLVFPNSQRINRGGMILNELVETCRSAIMQPNRISLAASKMFHSLLSGAMTSQTSLSYTSTEGSQV